MWSADRCLDHSGHPIWAGLEQSGRRWLPLLPQHGNDAGSCAGARDGLDARDAAQHADVAERATNQPSPAQMMDCDQSRREGEPAGLPGLPLYLRCAR